MRRFTVTAQYGEGRTRTLARVSKAEMVAFVRAALKYDSTARFSVTRHASDLQGVVWV